MVGDAVPVDDRMALHGCVGLDEPLAVASKAIRYLAGRRLSSSPILTKSPADPKSGRRATRWISGRGQGRRPYLADDTRVYL